jgi:hypothetical protein
MSTLVPFKVDEDSREVIWVEIEGAPQPPAPDAFGIIPTRKLPGLAPRALGTFRDLIAGIKPVVRAVYDTLARDELRPDKIEVEFGIKATSEAGLVLGKLSGEGLLNLRLTWNK